MKTIAVEIDDDTLAKAEKKADSLSTSVPQVVADYLRQWTTDQASLEEARREMIELLERPGRRFEVGTPDTREERNARH